MIYLLYIAFFFIFFTGMSFVAIPFIRQKRGLKPFVITTVCLFIFCITFYQCSGNKSALYAWINHGEQHYQLQEVVNQLGGIDGIITQIKNKVAANPNDAQGWFILSKLYLAKHDYAAAKSAYNKGMALSKQK